MITIHSAEDMQRWALNERSQGHSIGFVPTMGFLHRGHTDLMRAARPRVDRLVASIFVNPAQFNDPSDLDSYPRDEAGDLAQCAEAGCDLVFLPTVEDIYPDGYVTRVEVDRLTDHLCGTTRPGHFDGVSRVVAKLFNLVQPTLSVFGEKDFQQLAVVRRMTRDLNFPVEIMGYPTVREHDGLAMSSRNARLDVGERAQAPEIYRSLQQAKALVEAGERESAVLIAAVRERFATISHQGIDYVEVVGADDLQPLSVLDRPAVLAVAVHFTRSRLIDNIRLG